MIWIQILTRYLEHLRLGKTGLNVDDAVFYRNVKIPFLLQISFSVVGEIDSV